MGQAKQRTAAEARIEFKLEAWPIVRVDFIGEVTPQMFRQSESSFASAFDRAEREGERIDWLLQLGTLAPMVANAAMRKEAAEIARGMLPRMTTVTHAEACIINNAIVRGLFTAMTWILPLTWQAETFATESEALAWLHKLREQTRGASPATPRDDVSPGRRA